jgi:flavin-binding protein dodecin
MVQKVIKVVGVSPESFAKAAADAVAGASQSVRNMKWARVAEMEMGLDGDRVVDYRTTVYIYFDVETAGT